MLQDLTPAQLALAEYMSELSETAYYADWLHDLEHALWRAVTEGPFRFGHLDLSHEQIAKLKRLSDACGGWIRYDEQREEMFVSREEWIALHYDAPLAHRF